MEQLNKDVESEFQSFIERMMVLEADAREFEAMEQSTQMDLVLQEEEEEEAYIDFLSQSGYFYNSIVELFDDVEEPLQKNGG
jgi:hypothetical protein